MSTQSKNINNAWGINLDYNSNVSFPIPAIEFLKAIENIVNDAVEKRVANIEKSIVDGTLTAKETAELLKCSVRSLHNLKNSGKLIPISETGKSVRYRKLDVLSYLNPDNH